MDFATAAQIFGGFAIGMAVGSWLMARKWASNAQAVYRIEHGGTLYKVYECDEGVLHPDPDEFRRWFHRSGMAPCPK